MDGYLLRAATIAAMEGTAKVHFLAPEARRLNRSLGDATGLTGIGIHLIEVQPGDASTAHHLHQHEDEGIYVLSGHATATIGEEDFAIGPGDFIGCRKGGLAHSLRNTGPEVLRCLVMGERLAHDACDYPRHGQRLYPDARLPPRLVPLEAAPLPPTVGKK